jgi:hypothetical protein
MVRRLWSRSCTLHFLIHVRLVGSHLVRRKILVNRSQDISQTELSPTCWYKRQSDFVETSYFLPAGPKRQHERLTCSSNVPG